MTKSNKASTRPRSRGMMGRSTKGQSAAKAVRKSVRPDPKGPKGPGTSTKIASMTVMLCRIKGVSIGELCKHTGWQPHSVRAVISSVMKKKLGLDVVSEKVNGVRIYRVVV